MVVRCNVGSKSISKMGFINGFPEPVWYGPTGVTNILSLNIVKQYYRVEYDSATAKKNLFIIRAVILSSSIQLAKVYTLIASLRRRRKSDGHSLIRSKTTSNSIPDGNNWTPRGPGRSRTSGCFQAYVENADRGLIRNFPVTKRDIVNAEGMFGLHSGEI